MLIACGSLTSIAQNIDSLKAALKNPQHDTSKINILMELVENISDDNVWPQYNEQMLKLCEGLVTNKNALISKKAKNGLADAYNNIGFMYNNQGDIPNALDYFSKSLKIQEDIGNKAGVAELLSNIGVIYYYQKDVPKALDYYLKSLKIREAIGEKNALANSLNNIGNLYYDQNNIGSALYYCSKSLKLQEDIGDEEGMSYSLNNLGGIYFKKEDFTKALDYYDRSKNLRKKNADQQGVAASQHNIASVYFKLATSKNTTVNSKQQLTLAQLYADSSLILSKQLGFPANIRNAERLLSKIDSVNGNYNGAFEHYKQFVIYKDSISNEANHKASLKSQLKYVYDKKEAVLKEQQDKERLVNQEKNRFQQIVIWSVIFGLVLVIAFSFFIFRSLQHNKKANKIITHQRDEVNTKNHIIEEKQKEIIDSINYAKRIQYSLLAHQDFLNENFNSPFVYFNPKDIVSGDFYWATKTEDSLYLAVCDSTGHGVPGAFMSLLSIGFLSEAIKEKNIKTPNDIFNYVRERLTEAISKEGQKDGFDGILIRIELDNKYITYSAANNKPLLISGNKMTELVADRMPVGVGERKETFNLYTINAKEGDVLYLYTDGFADQFGGPKGKKFKFKSLNELLFSMQGLSFNQQPDFLKNKFESWRGVLEQVDDVCVIGVRL